ncbi:efflux RND transporter periplasmic adaptor subunit [uncultured Cetobacterium sp.]|uniref:efflux RND transporter periplasmic adaptor subunit n=1 Tax=uncultured Cetobacterium sp. TaxID=527638 RepID=UPI0026322ED4|nr:efflux RND transporter periplasmic adaptor subunit [uncultured Cetobacterium sp.]
MKRKLYILGIILTVLISILFFLFFKKNIIPAIKIKKIDYTEKILVTGTIQSKKFSTLTSGVNGIVESIYIREGENILKGDVIAKLDTQEIEADIARSRALYKKSIYDLEVINTFNLENIKSQLKSAQINYDIAKNEYLDFQTLFDKKYINKLDFYIKKNNFINSETQLKNIEAQLKSTEAQGATNKVAIENVNAAKNAFISLQKTLLKYYIFAPYDGYIIVRNVEVGQTVAPYTPMFEVSSSSDKIVSINLDEKYIGKVSLGSPIKVYPYADIKKYSTGNLYFLGINIDSSFGTLEIRGNIETPLPEFVFNSTANVVIDGQKFQNSILLQDIYTVLKKDKIFVYILKNNKSKLIEVSGTPVIDGFIITDGLEDGDIVLSPKNLIEGVRVKPKFD